MKFTHSLKTAVRGLNTHKSRSALTILGIVIGITAIILVIALGTGAQNLILGQIQSIGAKVIAVAPGREPHGPTDVFSTFTDSLVESDLTALENKSNVPHAEAVMPVVFGSQSALYQNETYRPTIFGASEEYPDVYNIYPGEGRSFSDEEVRAYSDVAVIGSEVKKELFGASDAIGEKIKIKGRSFLIIGILGSTGQVSFLNFDQAIFIPYTTAQRYLFGIKYFNRMVVVADDEKNVAATVADVKATIRAQHDILDPDKDDFFVETQAEAMATVGAITDALTLFLASVAAISLLVGGIGIMNIMLVSVTERTREIGLRKALGATEKNIMLQFLLEAVILTGVGGAIGIFLGGLFSFLISFVLTHVLGTTWAFVFPIGGAILGLSVSAGIGLVFGLYPARQASRKSPIEALRYE